MRRQTWHDYYWQGFISIILDGSAIASRLAKQINKVCAEIKNLLASYNSMNAEVSNDFKPITYVEILDVKSAAYKEVNVVSEVSHLKIWYPVSLKFRAHLDFAHFLLLFSYMQNFSRLQMTWTDMRPFKIGISSKKGQF